MTTAYYYPPSHAAQGAFDRWDAERERDEAMAEGDDEYLAALLGDEPAPEEDR